MTDDLSELFLLLVSPDRRLEATLGACGAHVARMNCARSAREAVDLYQFDVLVFDVDSPAGRESSHELAANSDCAVLELSSRPKSAGHLRKPGSLPIATTMLRKARSRSDFPDRTLVDWNRIRQYSGGDTQFEARLAREFLASADRAVSLLEASAHNGDLREVHREAHGLRGLCNILGASAVGTLCEGLEQLGERVDVDQGRALLAQLRRSVEANRLHLESLLLAIPA